MPSYNASPFAAVPEKLIPGKPAYLFGSWPSTTARTQGVINKVALATNVATVTVVINSGNVPAVGSLITITGVPNNSGAFNVTNIALTGVTIAADGTGTLTFALTHADVVAAAGAGNFIVPQPEVGEIVADGASVPVGLPYSVPFDAGQGVEAVQCEVNFAPITGLACVVALQGAMTNTPATVWQVVIANVVTVAAGVATYGTTQASGKWNFLRYSISGTTNASSAKIIAKLGS